MKNWAYYSLWIVSVACVACTAALISIAKINMAWQEKLQAQQEKLDKGILGVQAQQISSALLQSLADAAGRDAEIRRLMEKHGYRIPAVEQPAPAEGTQAGKAGNQP